MADSKINLNSQIKSHSAARRPRICLPTSRNLSRKTFQCGTFEAQDVLSEIDDVQLVAYEATPNFAFRSKLQRRLLYRDFTKQLIHFNPGVKEVTLEQDYDLFAVVCQNYWDLPYLNAIRDWTSHCRVSVCWLDEMWVYELRRYYHWIHILNQFDYVFLSQRGSVGAVSKALGRQCHWLPGGVDAFRFSPFPNPPERKVDLYSMGRRWEGIHHSLLQLSRQEDFFYVYDTLPVAFTDVYDHRQHREHFANLAKRSKFFMVAPGKMNASNETQGQDELGYRYFEGASAGAIMVGSIANSEAFPELFHWEDAVIPVKNDGSDVVSILSCLRKNPDRMERMSRRNAAEALLRHDWVYRWQKMFQIVGIQPSPGMTDRMDRLNRLAQLALGRS